MVFKRLLVNKENNEIIEWICAVGKTFKKIKIGPDGQPPPVHIINKFLYEYDFLIVDMSHISNIHEVNFLYSANEDAITLFKLTF